MEGRVVENEYANEIRYHFERYTPKSSTDMVELVKKLSYSEPRALGVLNELLNKFRDTSYYVNSAHFDQNELSILDLFVTYKLVKRANVIDLAPRTLYKLEDLGEDLKRALLTNKISLRK